MKIYFTEVVYLIRDFRCVPGHIFSTQNTFLGFRLEKYSNNIENIRITISKDHNNYDCLSI